MREGAISGARLAWASATDVGRVRTLNEDSFVDGPTIFAVADGMGGHDAGEVASALTVDRLRRLAAEGPLHADAVSAELQHINDLLRAAGSGSSRSTMGTTGVGMALVENGGMLSWLVFNVGDSRAYVLADGSLAQISRDHSYVQDLVEAGEIDALEARTHRHRNVVTRALGADDELQPDFWVRALRPGERFLLCSDGLTGELGDDVLADVLDAGFPADETVDCLVAMAVEAGGRDNVTAVVVDIVSVPSWLDLTTENRRNGRSEAGDPSTAGPDLIRAMPAALGPRPEHAAPRPAPPAPPRDPRTGGTLR